MAVTTKKKKEIKGLGRGLDALLGDAPVRKKPVGEGADGAEEGAPEAPRAGGRRELPIEHLVANKDQPRRVFSEDAIADLAASIKARGMLQPILVRPIGVNNYEIVAGERRWRAAQRAKLHNVPVIIRKLTDEEAAEIALIENVQRVDLNPVEEAQGYERLAKTFGRTQDEIAKRVGKSRSHVANMMRLLALPPRPLDALSVGAISMGHARALLGAPDPDKACTFVLKNKLSVRETEALARDASRAGKASSEGGGAKKAGDTKAALSASGGGSKDADTRALERDLASILGLEVEVAHSKKGAGAVTIKYLTLDQLDDVCKRLMGTRV
ncbi:MAG: ParB/RepB/Spo0J family partition protein [Pseudomonadota bacterium]